MPIRVSVSETYDLSTQPNKMSMIGIHTPDRKLIQKSYPGLCMNTKFCRIVSQDVVIACASMEPADPLQVGTSAGSIAPEDLFNPILYKAVSNDAMSQMEARIHGLMEQHATATIDGHQAIVDNDEVTPYANEFGVYYSLLSNRDGFRTANPQRGLEMRGLVPLVFEKLDTVGTWADVAGGSFHGIVDDTVHENTVDIGTISVKSIRGNAKPMPRFPTTFITGASPAASSVQGIDFQANGMDDGAPANDQIRMPELPPVFTSLIIMPPSRLHKLYYRLVVRTHLEFSEVRPIQEITGFYELSAYANQVYYSDYDDVSRRFADLKETQLDVRSADVTKVMEGR